MALRRFMRKLGLTKPLAMLIHGGYEERLDKAMMASLRLGDCAWDIGANVGLYTAKFSDVVGEQGRVFAFEPSPHNLVSLKQAINGQANVRILEVALADFDGEASFEETGGTGVTSRLSNEEGETSITVPVLRADDVIARGDAAPPNIVKIDVEGFELAVLKGMEATLRHKAIREIFVEVHFTQLDGLGVQDGARQIEDLLTAAGLTLKWLDNSHLWASRTSS